MTNPYYFLQSEVDSLEQNMKIGYSQLHLTVREESPVKTSLLVVKR